MKNQLKYCLNAISEEEVAGSIHEKKNCPRKKGFKSSGRLRAAAKRGTHLCDGALSASGDGLGLGREAPEGAPLDLGLHIVEVNWVCIEKAGGLRRRI